ncbi:hypothetical protein NDS46_28860 [Paenibacillus thiaminolyticus]|nr:hypothetical protein [Paenibacillus thiaminolyticus]WCF08217.1 hypothetical protein NDS46_28860 [Paenibacillus thiaminolyticus]
MHHFLRIARSFIPAVQLDTMLIREMQHHGRIPASKDDNPIYRFP